jgi:MFS transporter, FHS family, glucose/mannose:H+ symporter
MIIVAAILAIFVYGMIAATLGTILPALSETFGMTPAESGFVALAQGLGLAVASVSVGPLIDNKGKKTGLLLGLGLVSASLFTLPSSTGYAMVMAVFFLLGVGGGIIVTGANTLVSDVGEDRRATLMNFLNLFFGLGGLATPFIAANLIGGDPYKLCYLMAGFTAFTFVVHIFAPIPPPTGERGFKFTEMGALLNSPALWLLSLFLFLYVACEVGVWNWLVTHLKAQGVEEATAQNMLGFGFALGLLVGRVAVAPILMKIKPATVTLGAAVLMAITTFAMLQIDGATAIGVAVFCAGLAMAPVFPTTLAMVGDTFPKATATAMGIVITFGWIGLMVSSPIIGGMAGDDPAGLATALLLLPALSIVMILVNLVLRPVLAKAKASATA